MANDDDLDGLFLGLLRENKFVRQYRLHEFPANDAITRLVSPGGRRQQAIDLSPDQVCMLAQVYIDTASMLWANERDEALQNQIIIRDRADELAAAIEATPVSYRAIPDNDDEALASGARGPIVNLNSIVPELRRIVRNLDMQFEFRNEPNRSYENWLYNHLRANLVEYYLHYLQRPWGLSKQSSKDGEGGPLVRFIFYLCRNQKVDGSALTQDHVYETLRKERGKYSL